MAVLRAFSPSRRRRPRSRPGFANFNGLRIEIPAPGNESTRNVRHDTIAPDVETASSGYASRFDGAIGQWMLSIQTQCVRGLLEQCSPRRLRILEIGGGHGQLTPLFVEAGHHVTVHGSADHALTRTQILKETCPDRVALVVSPLWEIPAADQAFDLVVGIRLLAHVEAWERLLREFSRLSARWVLFDYPPLWSANLLTPVLFHLKRAIEGNTRPYFCYRGRRLRSALRAEGFEEVATERQYALPMGIHRAAARPRFSQRAESALAAIGVTHILGSPALLMAQRGRANAS